MSYDFECLINEAYESLETRTKTNLVLPKVESYSTVTRLHWKNIMDYLKLINRTPEHFINYIKTENPDKEISWMSGELNEGIIIHGKFLKQQLINDIIIKYINSFVICSACKSYNTELIKKSSKLYYFECIDCEHNKNM